MSKPKKITVTFVDFQTKKKVKEDEEDIKKALQAKQDEADDACPFC